MTDAPKPKRSLRSWFGSTWARSSGVGKAGLVLGALIFFVTGVFLFWIAWIVWQSRDDNLGRGLAIAAGIAGVLWFGSFVSYGLAGGSTTVVDSTTTTLTQGTSTTTASSSTSSSVAKVTTTATSAPTSTTSQETTSTTSKPTTTTSQPTTTTTKATTTSSKPTTTTTEAENCDPYYPDFCIPPPPPDLNCSDIPQKNFTVLQPDPHGFDGNKDGVGCES